LAVCSTSQFQINRYSERRNLIIHEHNDTYPCFMLKSIGRKVFLIIGPHFQTFYWEMTFLWLKSSYSLHLSREVLSHSYTFALFWLFVTPKLLQLAARKCQRFSCTVMACDYGSATSTHPVSLLYFIDDSSCSERTLSNRTRLKFAQISTFSFGS
jgi:hypothetical protein